MATEATRTAITAAWWYRRVHAAAPISGAVCHWQPALLRQSVRLQAAKTAGCGQSVTVTHGEGCRQCGVDGCDRRVAATDAVGLHQLQLL